MGQDQRVTAVATSCGRHDLLSRTLDSFFRFNTYPLAAVLVIEDGLPIPQEIQQQYGAHPVRWRATEARMGQIAAIDRAYSEVFTPYIFHFEDDWEFYQPSFIEKSLLILEAQPQCIQVHLRAHNDTNGYPLLPETHLTEQIPWRKLASVYNYDGNLWYGFSFNPGLRRLSDYNILRPYSDHVAFDFQVPWQAERQLSELYHRKGYFAAILSDHHGSGYVRHLGRGRRVAPPERWVE